MIQGNTSTHPHGFWNFIFNRLFASHSNVDLQQLDNEIKDEFFYDEYCGIPQSTDQLHLNYFWFDINKNYLPFDRC